MGPKSSPIDEQPHPNDVVFLMIPVELFRKLSEEAGLRQQNLAQFLASAVSDYLKKPYP